MTPPQGGVQVHWTRLELLDISQKEADRFQLEKRRERRERKKREKRAPVQEKNKITQNKTKKSFRNDISLSFFGLTPVPLVVVGVGTTKWDAMTPWGLPHT